MTDKRNYSLDLFRIFLTLMICTLHILGQGGILKVSIGTSNSLFFWIVNAVCICAVDGYGLLTGFHASTKATNYQKLIFLWFQVFFYSALLTIGFKVIKPDLIPINTVIKSLFPLTMGIYWYFSAYFALYILSPYINKFLFSLKKNEILRLSITLILLFCGLNVINDCFSACKGFSVIWLICLYIFGYTLKVYINDIQLSKIKIIFIILLLSLISVIPQQLFDIQRLLIYVSPTILFIAVLLFILFYNLSIPNTFVKFIKYLSPLTFGIYLFQNSPIIWQLIRNQAAWINQFPIATAMLLLLLISVVLFACGTIVELCRATIFKLLNINQLSEFITKKCKSTVNFLVNQFSKHLN